MKRTTRLPLVAWTAALATGVAHGAGGHHAIDDAAILDPGQCQVEAWVDRERDAARTLAHVGPACRVGAVELGFNVDRVRSNGLATMLSGAQIKWARELQSGLSAGVALAVAVPNRRPHALLGTVVVPATWQASDTLAVHANLGRDLVEGGANTSHAGAALEWAATPAWLFIGERFREAGTNRWRVGARWSLSSTLSLDLSRAQGQHRSPPPWWTFGVTWLFEP